MGANGGRSGHPLESRAASGAEQSWAARIDLVVQSLQSHFGPAVDPALIRAEVEAGFAAHAEARVREFVPVLVENRVRSQLAQSRFTQAVR